MNSSKYLYFIGLSLILIACSSRFEGYESVDDNIYFKLVSFDENGYGLTSAHKYVGASVKVLDGDVIIYQQYKTERVALNDFLFNDVLTNVHTGDSILLLVNSVLFKGIKGINLNELSNEFLSVQLKVENYFSDTEHKGLLAQEDKDSKEFLLIKEYIEPLKNVNLKSGIYKQIINAGNGEIPQKGNKLFICYEGKFLNGIAFDNAFKEKTFEYVFGTPGQVIPGFDLALSTMREGEKSKIIIPSHLAFGSEGSSTGIVPANTPVLFNLELKKIIK